VLCDEAEHDHCGKVASTLLDHAVQMTRRVEPAGRHVKQLAAIESPSSICSNILIAFMDMRADAQRGQKSAL